MQQGPDAIEFNGTWELTTSHQETGLLVANGFIESSSKSMHPSNGTRVA